MKYVAGRNLACFFHFHVEVEAGVFNYGRFFSVCEPDNFCLYSCRINHDEKECCREIHNPLSLLESKVSTSIHVHDCNLMTCMPVMGDDTMFP